MPARRPLRLPALLGGLSLVLAACGGDDPAPPEPQDPLQPYRTQVLQWQACDTSSFDEYDQASVVALGSQVQCTSMRAPVDYAHPERGDLSVGLLRVSAKEGAAQRQILLFNPGGPGSDGLPAPLDIALLWQDSTNATETGRLQQQLLRTYDLIGFSPRGLGSSTELRCESHTPLPPTDNSITGRNPENIAQQLRNLERIAQACEQNPLTPHINTEATVQDMDLMRAALGAERLNYLGWSYGTWLGAWYSSRFPERADRMILDSSVDFSVTLHDAYLQQPPALTRAFNEVLAPYAARHPDAFELGTDVDVIRGMAAHQHPAVQQAVSSLLYGPLFSAYSAPQVFRRLIVGQALSQEPFRASLPVGVSGGDFERLHELVDGHTFSADPQYDEELRDVAHMVVEKIHSNTRPAALHLVGETAVYTSVVCNDTPSPNPDAQWWIDQETAVYRDYPLVGIDDFRSCLYWTPPQSVHKPSLVAMQKLDVLMLQAQYDGATNAEGARRTFAQLPAAHLVFVRDEMSHAVYPYHDECADLTVARYLARLPTPQRELSCAGKPLELDEAQAAGLPRHALGAQGSYADPAAAAAIIERMKSKVLRAAATEP